MATLAYSSARSETRLFYVWMSAAIALFAFGAFAPTYWMQLPAGTFVGTPLVHIHSAFFSAWTLLLLSQTWLASQRRLAHHRAWGMAGIALASAMVMLGIAVAVASLKARLAMGHGDAARAFLIIPLSAILLFSCFFVAAVANVNRAEAHKRLMLLASISLLPAALARVKFFLSHGLIPGGRPGLDTPQPVANLFLPHLFLELFIVAGLIYDWRTRGRPHPAWLIGAGVMTLVFLLRAPIAATPGWLSFADATTRIAG